MTLLDSLLLGAGGVATRVSEGKRVQGNKYWITQLLVKPVVLIVVLKKSTNN